MDVKERLTTDDSVVDGYTLKGLCTFGRDGEPTDEMGCAEFCEFNEKDCYRCPIQEASNRLAEYENTGLSPAEIKKLKKRLDMSRKELSRRREMNLRVCKLNENLLTERKNTKSEAIREFAERLKVKAACNVVHLDDIDSIVREMTESSDGRKNNKKD